MAVIRGELEAGKFFVMRRAAIEDERLSLKAKGLLAYLLSKPPGWKVSTSQLASMGPDGKDAVGAAMRELVGCGYSAMVEVRDMGVIRGYDYIITDCPESAGCGNPAVNGKPGYGAECGDGGKSAWSEGSWGEGGAGGGGGKPAVTGKSATSNNDLSLSGSKNTTPHTSPQSVRKIRRKRNARTVAEMRAHEEYPRFREAWTELPVRAGSNPELAAFQAYLTHASKDADHEVLVEGAKRYATYCDEARITGTEIVMQASRFFGPRQEWNQDWEIPVHSNGRKR